MISIFVLAVLLGHLAPGYQQQTAAEEELPAKLQRQVEEYTLTADNFLQALTKTAAQFRIPIGVEWIRSPMTSGTVQFSWRSATPEGILRALVDSQPGYELEVKNGIVHIFPRKSVADKNNFLNIQIDKFSVRNEYVAFASHRLWAQVHRTVVPPLTPGGGEAGSIASGAGDRQISFELENVTVRDILDKLALAAGLKVWVVTYPENPSLTRAGFRSAISVFNENYPIDAQPIWDLLLWGFDPMTKIQDLNLLPPDPKKP